MTDPDGDGATAEAATGDRASTAGARSGRRAARVAFLADVGILGAKALAASITGSASMLAETLHSLADTGNQSLLLLGQRRSRRRPTAERPFGYGGEVYFWGFVVAIVLFALGALFSLAEGVEKVLTPHDVRSSGWALGVLAFSAVLDGLSLRTARREANRSRRGGWIRFVRETRQASVMVVLVEDFAALTGIALAFVGVVLSDVTGDARFDAMGSLAIGVLLGTLSIVLAGEMKSLLIGERADERTEAAIVDALHRALGERLLLDVRTLHLGPDRLLVGARVEAPSGRRGRSGA